MNSKSIHELIKTIQSEALRVRDDEADVTGRRLRESMPDLSKVFVDACQEANRKMIRSGDDDPDRFPDIAVLTFMLQAAHSGYSNYEIGRFLKSFEDDAEIMREAKQFL